MDGSCYRSVMKPAPILLAWLLTKLGKQAITLPPWGIYVLPGHEGLLAHEQVHWQQYERMGFWRYYVTYLWYQIRYGYENNPMEVEARKAP